MTLLPTCVDQTLRHSFEKTMASELSPRSPRSVVGPPPLPLLTIPIAKRSKRDRLGLSFRPDAIDGGALITALDFGSLAWRSKLRPGDIVRSVIIDGAEHPMEGGYQAAGLLRPATGVLRLRVRRRKLSAEEVAARRIQAAARGMEVRAEQHEANLAATYIQAAWRRAEAMVDYADALWAAELIQDVAREQLERRKRRRREAGSTKQIRAPACLD